MKQYERYYTMINNNQQEFIKLTNELIFSVESGYLEMKRLYPNASQIKYLKNKYVKQYKKKFGSDWIKKA